MKEYYFARKRWFLADDADIEFERLETEIKKRDEKIKSLRSEISKKDEIISNANKKFKEFTDTLCRKVLKSKDELTVAVQDAQQDFYEKFIAILDENELKA